MTKRKPHEEGYDLQLLSLVPCGESSNDLFLDWQATDGIRLVAEGPELRIEQDLSATVEMTLSAVYDLREFRLNEGEALDRGVVCNEQVFMGASLGWRPDASVRLRVGGGHTLWRELKFIDRGDLQLGRSAIPHGSRPRPHSSLSLRGPFHAVPWGRDRLLPVMGRTTLGGALQRLLR